MHVAVQFIALRLLAVILFALSLPALAEESALATVQATTARMLAAVRAERESIRSDSQRLHRLVEQFLLPVVDRERIARWVLGRHWRTATPVQRERFVDEFQTLLIRTYAAPLLDYLDVEIAYPPTSMDPAADDVVIRSEIRAPGRKPVPVHYSLHRRGGVWQVYDVTIAGVSAVVTLRSTFSDEIQKLGLEEFIRRLAEKNRDRT